MLFEVNEGRVQVFTYKAGLLSKVAHDLQLTVQSFSIRVDGVSVSAHFDLASIDVDGIIRRGALKPNALSRREKADILSTMRSKVLQISEYPAVVLQGTLTAISEHWRLDVTLQIRGVKQPVEIVARRSEGRLRGQVELVPSRWGITPYRALLGAIQLQDRVTVVFDIPAGPGLD